MPRTTLGVTTLAALFAAVLVVRPGSPPQVAAQPPAQGDALPADLAMVPADAIGFVHVRLADLWKNDVFREVRKTWLAAGDEALKALDEQFVPAPSSLDRVTVFALPDPGGKLPRLFGVIAFSAPFDRDKLVKAYFPDAKTRQVSGKTVYTPRGSAEVAVTFPDDRHVLIGANEGIDGYLSKPPAKDGPLAGALKLATARPVIAAANLSAVPDPADALFEPLKDLRVDLRPVFKAELVLLAIDLGNDAKIEVKAAYPDEAAARRRGLGAALIVEGGRSSSRRKGSGRKLSAKDTKIRDRPTNSRGGHVRVRSGCSTGSTPSSPTRSSSPGRKNLALTVSMPKEVVAMAGLSAPILGFGFYSLASRSAVSRSPRRVEPEESKQPQADRACDPQLRERPRQAPADIKDKDGKPILSWRVAILPYMEQDNLYKQFKLDEPWTRAQPEAVATGREGLRVTERQGPHGRREGEKPSGRPTTSACPPGTMFDPTKAKLTFADVTDGLSNTVRLVETRDPVASAQPGDLLIYTKKPVPMVSAAGMDGVTNVLLGDGSVRKADTKKVSERTLRNAFLRNDGMPMGADW